MACLRMTAMYTYKKWSSFLPWTYHGNTKSTRAMKVSYYFSAVWRKKDLDFLKSLGLAKNLKTGQGHFTVSNPELCEKIFEYFEKPDGLLKKAKPDKYYSIPASVSFNKEEFNSANIYNLRYTGDSLGNPEPFESYPFNTFNFECVECLSGKKQKHDFRMNPKKLKKYQKSFILFDYDIIFFERDFYLSFLKPLGLNHRNIINNKTGEVLQEVVQLDIPEAKSKLVIQGHEFGESEICKGTGKTQYGIQTLDFFPPFEEEFDFTICKTREEFIGGLKRILISRDFMELMVEHKIVKYNQYQLTPVKNNEHFSSAL